jgi:hypothetical protein
LVFLVGIGCYFPGIYHTNIKEKPDCMFWNQSFDGNLFFPQKEGSVPRLDAASPPFEEKMSSCKKIHKRSSCQFFKKELLPKLKVPKIPTNIPTTKCHYHTDTGQTAGIGMVSNTINMCFLNPIFNPILRFFPLFSWCKCSKSVFS